MAVNYSLPANGGTTTATAAAIGGSAAAATDGDRVYANGNCTMQGVPNTITSIFSAVRNINQFRLYFTKNDYASTVEATESDTFTLYSPTAFVIKTTTNGTTWTNYQTITGNNFVYRKFDIAEPGLDILGWQVTVSSSSDNYVRIAEMEAWHFDLTAPTVTLSAAAPSSSQVNLTYSAADDSGGSGVANWDLDWSADGSTGWTPLLSASTTASPFSHTGRTAGTQYFYRFRARDADGNGSTYVYANATTAAYVPPVVAVTPWTQKRIVPIANLAAWLSLDDQTPSAGSDISYLTDLTGSGRTVTASSNKPVFAPDLLNGYGGVYFGGTKNPLQFAGSLVVKHLFILAGFDGASFTGYEGLFTALTGTSVLRGGGAGSQVFYNNSTSGGFQYRIADVILPQSNQLAPVGGKAAIIEIINPNGFSLDGLQIGQDVTDTTRRWKGWFFEGLFYDAVKDDFSRERVYEFFARKYHVWRQNSAGLHIFPFVASHTRTVNFDRQVYLSNAYSGKQNALLRGGRNVTFDALYDGNRTQTEFDAANAFNAQHYGVSDFVFRDWKYYPARDFTVKFNSGIKDEGGETCFFNYAFGAAGSAAAASASTDFGIELDNSGDVFIISRS